MVSSGQACLPWMFPVGATGRCQGTGRHSGVSKLEGGGWNKEEESTSLSVVDVRTRWANSPVEARSCNMGSTPSSKKSIRGVAIVKELLSADAV